MDKNDLPQEHKVYTEALQARDFRNAKSGAKMSGFDIYEILQRQDKNVDIKKLLEVSVQQSITVNKELVYNRVA